MPAACPVATVLLILIIVHLLHVMHRCPMRRDLSLNGNHVKCSRNSMRTHERESCPESLAVLQHRPEPDNCFQVHLYLRQGFNFILDRQRIKTSPTHRPSDVKKQPADGTMPRSIWNTRPALQTPSAYILGPEPSTLGRVLWGAYRIFWNKTFSLDVNSSFTNVQASWPSHSQWHKER